MEEYFDVVDGDDRVVGHATRGECHTKNLIHRSVMFFLFDSNGRIFVNRRSKKKEFFGGLWSMVFGGHVQSGDTYDNTVVREAEEEAGVTAKPFWMGRFKKRLQEERENVEVYGFITEGGPTLQKEEVEHGSFMTVEEAKALTKKEKFIPETGQLLHILNERVNALKSDTI